MPASMLPLARLVAGRAGLLLLLLLLVPACSGKDAVAPPEVTPQQVVVESGVVSWTTVEPARGAVRYGFSSGDYDHVAYPASANRADRSFRTQHRVPLLDLAVGRTVFFQALSEAEQGSLRSAPEQSFVSGVDGPDGVLSSTMIHIGWGDCHLITMPSTGKRLLIDAGDSGAANAVEEYFTAHGVDHLDAALATHLHADHLGGFVGRTDDDSDGVLEFAPPVVFFDRPSYVQDHYLRGATLAILDRLDIERRVIQRGDTDQTVAELALDPEVHIRVLNSGLAPDVPVSTYDGDNYNNESIVLRLSYGDVDFIIGGDAEWDTQASIVAAFGPAALDSEYYKAQHHGRNDGTSASYVNAIRPRISLVPVTADEYEGGLPDLLGDSSAALGLIENAGADLYRIDDLPAMGVYRGSGANYNVTFATDGLSYEIRAELARQTAKLPPLSAHPCEEHPEPAAAPPGR